MEEPAYRRWLVKFAPVEAGEARALLWSFAWFFCLLAGYYVLRPLRDEMGIAAGRDYLQYLFTATFFVMLAASPVYAAAIAKLPRRRFIPLVYHFFVLNIAIFWLALQSDLPRAWIARVFFVWVSVFNLFAVSVFWSFMADLWRSEQGKRLFGFIAAGGTAGALIGPSLTVALAKLLGPAHLLIVAVLFIEAAIFCAGRLERALGSPGDGPTPQAPRADKAIGGGILDGFMLILRSPYLAAIAAWVALLSFAGTFLYFQQQDVVRAASDDPAVRTRIFATMDLAANLMTLAIQFLATGQLIRRIGAGPAAAVLPFVFAVGFAALAFTPGLMLVVVFQALQRTANFAMSNPAREILFTAAAREEKYKAKNIIDTSVFRGGDVAWSWAYAGLRGAGLTGHAIAALAVPACLAWLALSLALGRAQERRAALIAANGEAT